MDVVILYVKLTFTYTAFTLSLSDLHHWQESGHSFLIFQKRTEFSDNSDVQFGKKNK